jgi:hypothetical protein
LTVVNCIGNSDSASIEETLMNEKSFVHRSKNVESASSEQSVSETSLAVYFVKSEEDDLTIVDCIRNLDSAAFIEENLSETSCLTVCWKAYPRTGSQTELIEFGEEIISSGG